MDDRWSQLTEVSLLQSVYCQTGEFQTDPSGLLARWQLEVASGEDETPPGSGERVNYQLHVQMGDAGTDTQATIDIECTMPHDYPSASMPSLYVRSSSSLFDTECSRRCNESLQSWLRAHDRDGDPVVLEAIEWLGSEMSAWLSDSRARQQARASAANFASASSAGIALASSVAAPVVFHREWVFFHHVYNRTKRRIVLDTAAEHGCTGVLKTGKPGIAIVEGDADAVAQWLTRIRGLTWQKMSSRHSERATHHLTPTEAASLSSRQAARTSFLRSQSRFDRFTDLKPLPGAEWPDMAQLVECLAQAKLDSTLREILGVASCEEDGADDANSDDESGPAITSPTSTPVTAGSSAGSRAPNKRLVKEAGKRLAQQSEQTRRTENAAAAVAPIDLLRSDLECVQVVPVPSSGAHASSGSSTPATHSVRLHVTVRPNASSTEAVSLGVGGESLHLRLHAPPRDGQANKEVQRYIASTMRLAASQVQIVAGDKSREKVVLLTAVRAGDICAKLRALCSDDAHS